MKLPLSDSLSLPVNAVTPRPEAGASMSDLFPLQESLSPKLRWLAAHNLRTNLDELPRSYIGPATTLPWVCGS